MRWKFSVFIRNKPKLFKRWISVIREEWNKKCYYASVFVSTLPLTILSIVWLPVWFILLFTVWIHTEPSWWIVWSGLYSIIGVLFSLLIIPSIFSLTGQVYWRGLEKSEQNKTIIQEDIE